MADHNFYRFSSVWFVDSPPQETYDALKDIGSYPKWWPEVKEVYALDGGRAQMRARSLLPYDLRFVSSQSETDSTNLVLEMTMVGDLEGFARFHIEACDGGSRLVFEEEVTANKKLLRRLGRVARAAFIANHALMMRRGQAGLRVYMAGFSDGRAAHR
jgi:Polyketide cyclase / dehydrase and lipid transport